MVSNDDSRARVRAHRVPMGWVVALYTSTVKCTSDSGVQV